MGSGNVSSQLPPGRQSHAHGSPGHPIPPPSSGRDVLRFLNEVEQHEMFRRVDKRIQLLAEEAKEFGEPDVKRWSIAITRSQAQWDVGREKRHNRIADEAFVQVSCRPTNRPAAIIVMGPPGAGKTSIGVEFVRNSFGDDFVSIDPDEVKERLPEYQGWNASALHAESKDIVDRRLLPRAMQGRCNMLLDVVGADKRQLRDRIQAAALTHNVYLLLIHIPHWVSTGRVWERFLHNPFRLLDCDAEWGRFVPTSLRGGPEGAE